MAAEGASTPTAGKGGSVKQRTLALPRDPNIIQQKYNVYKSTRKFKPYFGARRGVTTSMRVSYLGLLNRLGEAAVRLHRPNQKRKG